MPQIWCGFMKMKPWLCSFCSLNVKQEASVIMQGLLVILSQPFSLQPPYRVPKKCKNEREDVCRKRVTGWVEAYHDTTAGVRSQVYT